MAAIFRWSALLCALLAGFGAQAQNYPERPIHLIIAFVPGGATDTMARQIQQDLSEALGQTVVVENRPGGSGYIAWNYVANAKPDGYTLLMAENAVVISPALYRRPFDPVKQFAQRAIEIDRVDILDIRRHVEAFARVVRALQRQAGRIAPEAVDLDKAGSRSVGRYAHPLAEHHSCTRAHQRRQSAARRVCR